jgi:hypothetical protein
MRRIRCDDRHRREELDVHFASSFTLCVAEHPSSGFGAAAVLESRRLQA